jgi:hypothetical protein
MSTVFLTMMTHSIDGTMKSRQTSRVSYWKVQGECSSFSNIPNDNNLTVFYSRFRLASLQISELRDCHSEDELEGQLQCLPHDLDEVYDRIISSIIRHREDALTILQWLSFSARPLKLAEVAQVTCVVPDTDQGLHFKPSRILADPRSVLMICSSLVTEIDG